jgi:hypothetical protein
MLFVERGMLKHDNQSNIISLEDDRIKLNLLFKTRRKLLSRVYHLNIVSRMVPLTEYSANKPYTLKLRVRGFKKVEWCFSVVGSGIENGRAVADRLLSSGIIARFAGSVDIESLLIDWSPESDSWNISVGPFPGSFVYMSLPPIKYNVKLRKSEVEAIYDFFDTVSDFFDARCIL